MAKQQEQLPELNSAEREFLRGKNGWKWASMKQVKPGQRFRYDIDVNGQDRTAYRAAVSPSASEFFTDWVNGHLKLTLAIRMVKGIPVILTFPDDKQVEIQATSPAKK
jgi:hypothetical protein